MLYHQPNAKRRWYAVNGKKQIQQAYASILDNDFEQAIRSFEQAIKLEPDNPEYHFRLSITYARSGKLSSALKHAQRACELEPAHETYRYQLLHLQAMELVREAEKLAEAGGRRRLRQATRLLREAILKDPLSLEAYLLLSAVHAELGNFRLAAEAAQEALKLNPQHEDVLQHIKRYHDQFAPYMIIE